jgi:hypothetical protein
MKWEYKLIKLPVKAVLNFGVKIAETEHELNSLGKLGWELVNIVGHHQSRLIVAILQRTR